jgi:hypothetical protein
MLVQHHTMPWSAFLVIYLKHEDFHIISKDLFHVKSWPRKRVSRSRGMRFMLNLVLKNVVATLKETSDLLQNICAEISRFQLIFSQDLRITPILHSGYINRDRRPNYSLKPQFTRESFRVLVCCYLWATLISLWY